MLRTLTFISCLLIPSVTLGQSVRGRVLDAETGRPITEVKLVLINSLGVRVAETLSRAPDGLFAMAAREQGKHVIEAEFIGYRTARTATFDIRSREQLIVDIKLSRSAIQLEPLIVTGRRRDARLEPTVEGMYARAAITPPIGSRRVILHSDLEMRSAIRPTDALDGIPVRSCMTVYWNGNVIHKAATAGMFLDLPATEFEGVEFYNTQLDAPIIFRDKGAEIPPPVFGVAEGIADAVPQGRRRESQFCSVLVLWSRQPWTRWGTPTIRY